MDAPRQHLRSMKKRKHLNVVCKRSAVQTTYHSYIDGKVVNGNGCSLHVGSFFLRLAALTLHAVRSAAVLAAGVLGGEGPAPDEPLMEAGLDSLAAVELRNAAAATFAVSLPATAALDHPTLRALAAAVASLIAAAAPLPGDCCRRCIAARVL